MSYLERLCSHKISHSEVYIAGAVLRMALFSLPEVVIALQRRPELSTPLTSFRSSKSAVSFSSMMTYFTVRQSRKVSSYMSTAQVLTQGVLSTM